MLYFAGVVCAVRCNVCVKLQEFFCVLFEKLHACPMCLFFPYQRDDEDGGDMDSYQVLLLSILWHGAQLLLIASIAKQRAGRRKEGHRARTCSFSLAFDLL